MDQLERAAITYRDDANLACRVARAEVDQYATEIARDLAFHPGDDIFSVVEQLGGRIRLEPWAKLKSEEATILVHGPNDFDIALSRFGHSRRDRFTIAHELGHYFLHSKQGDVPMKANRQGSNLVEWEANWFAAGFLMPEQDFRRLVAADQSDTAIADHFRVSEPAVEVRKKVLGI